MPIQQMLVGISKGEKFAEATGGDSVTTVGDYKVHTFTSTGTFTVTQLGDVNEFEVLLVAGGAGPGTQWASGGGGGGGIVNHQTGQALTAAQYDVVIGAGGAGSISSTSHPSTASGNQGSDSNLHLHSNSSIVLEADISDIANLPGMSLPQPQANNKNSWNVYMHSTGGNSAKVVNGTTTQYQGKGGWHQTGYAGGAAGAGADGDPVNSTSDSTQSYTPAWANGGGCSAGGGGGAGYATNMVSGSTAYYGGGGGAGTGGAGCSGHNNFVAPGGAGGGGNGSCQGSSGGGVQAQNGTVNTGGGGGGGSQGKASGNGGSGVAYIKYKFQ